ncbi:uncharacterized protein TNCV_1411901 [Trichonephila clavipes]|nr:uncharacterized protein TNCV_1411901 [Trichonephila clavipes]
MAPGLGSTAGEEGCSIQAISRCLSLVLLCETVQCHVTKSLCHVFWPILVTFRSMRSLAGLSEFIIHNTTLVPPDTKAAVAEWYRYRTVTCLVTSSSPVPLKTRRVGQRCTLNLLRAETSSRWCGVVVKRGGASSSVVHVP